MQGWLIPTLFSFLLKMGYTEHLSKIFVKGGITLAGKFITNTNRADTINTIASAAQQLLNNPYYLFSDKKGSVSTYYNLNTTMTTLDEATRSNYGEISAESPLRFNKIIGFLLFGITQMNPNLDIGEFGLETSDIVGEAYVLPKTIVPYPGDYFYLDQLENKYLFKVTAVNPNTLDTGSIMYKINYTLIASDGSLDIEPQVVKTFRFSTENIGSNFGCLIEEEKYNTAERMEELLTMLKDFYISLFYDAKVQTFTYYNGGDAYNNYPSGGSRAACKGCLGFKAYDPYLIEFMMQNNLLKGSTQYIYIQQQMYLPMTFPVDYARTIFNSIEEKDLSSHIGVATGNLILCEQKLSLLYAYPQDYYYMEYKRLMPGLYPINIFDDEDFINKIKSNTKTKSVMKNILIAYFNNESLTEDMLTGLKHIDYCSNRELFYMIPITIYCLEQYLVQMLS